MKTGWILILASQFISTLTSGVVEINLLSYKNELSKDNDGYCCRDVRQNLHTLGSDESKCNKECSTFFRICLKEFQSVINTNNPNCTYGSATTAVLGLGYSMAKLSQPLQFPFSFRWRGDFTLIIDVWHSASQDDGEYNKLLLKIAEGKKLAADSNWTTEWHRNLYSQLQLQYRMVCDKGYYGSGCGQHCGPRDDQFDHFVCSEIGEKICIPGWEGENCDTAICLPGCHSEHGSCSMPNDCKCKKGYKGPLCDQCVKYPGCQHGTCEKAFDCICEEGWGGIFCNQDLNYCTKYKPCKNNATCTNTGPGLYTCLCGEGFTGTNCELIVETCSTNRCFNGGTCIDGITNFTCTCPKGFTGRQCRTKAESCFENPCENGATCFDSAQGYLCSCSVGWEGHNCDVKVDYCQSKPCKNGGICQSANNGFSCACPMGYVGSICEVDSDDCSSQPCLNGGTCLDKVNSFQCKCLRGFGGTLCQTEMDACTRMPCNNGATCFRSTAGYKCLCPPGFHGETCSIPVRDCVVDYCKSGGTCLNSEFGFFCQCSACYTGNDCSIIVSKCNVSSSWNVPTDQQPLSVHTYLVLILCLSILLLLLIVILTFGAVTVRRRLYGRDTNRWCDEEARKQNELNDRKSEGLYDYKDRFVLKVENDLQELDKVKNISDADPSSTPTTSTFRNPNILESTFAEDRKLNSKANIANKLANRSD